MTFDEVIAKIISDTTNATLAGKVFHLEVYQTNESFKNFPCALYNMRANMPFIETSGVSGYSTAEYSVTIVSKDSDILRNSAQSILNLASDKNNEDLYTTYSGDGFEWLDIVTDEESLEYAIELQEKGYKTTSMQLVYFHREVTNNVYSS
jgi:hypothetical protein